MNEVETISLLIQLENKNEDALDDLSGFGDVDPYVDPNKMPTNKSEVQMTLSEF